jgi:hypothetical protein
MFFDVEIAFFLLLQLLGGPLVADRGAGGRRGLRVGRSVRAEDRGVSLAWRVGKGLVSFLPIGRRRCWGVGEVEDGQIYARGGGGRGVSSA